VWRVASWQQNNSFLGDRLNKWPVCLLTRRESG
jgi:hypothetical protein